MSVVNKMLRDLDGRGAAQGMPDAQPATAPVTRGTSSVAPLARRRTWGGAGLRARVAWCVSLCCLAAGTAWWLVAPMTAPQLVPKLSATGASGPSETVTASLASGGATSAPSAPATSSAVAAASASMLLARAPVALPTLDAAVSPAARTGSVNLPAAGSTSITKPGPARPGLAVPGTAARLDASAHAMVSVEPAPATPRPVAATAPLLPTTAAAVVVPWQDAAMETVAQAQRLWNTGSRDAAAEMLREAVLALERLHRSDTMGAAGTATLATLRELVRMELALGQPTAVLALLRRHEPWLGGNADLWALRASAAQRVGQYAESSHAYQTALKIRPGEPRWMLGAAVSMAALGQTLPAAELVEQARALQVVSPEVLIYLRQLGVPLRER